MDFNQNKARLKTCFTTFFEIHTGNPLSSIYVCKASQMNILATHVEKTASHIFRLERTCKRLFLD